VFGKALLEKLVGQDASLWETMHPLASLHVDVTVQCFVKEAVVVDGVLCEKRERHFHIFIPVKWRFKIHVLDVSSGKSGASGADGDVPKEFREDHVSGTSGEFKWINDKVATDGDTDAVGILFLGTMINDSMSIHYHSVGWDTANVFMGEEENGVGSCGDFRFALGEMMWLLAHCRHPEVLEVWIMLQFFILCDGLLGNRMDYSETMFFDVNGRPGPL
jgi:hypothetical protein